MILLRLTTAPRQNLNFGTYINCNERDFKVYYLRETVLGLQVRVERLATVELHVITQVTHVRILRLKI